MRYILSFLLALVSVCGFAADLNHLLARAKADDATAQYQLGTMYSSGDGVERSPDQAFAWFQKAARQGHAGAMYNLGVACYNGDTLGGTVPTDVQQAWIWFSLSAEKGDPAAKQEAQRVWGELSPFARNNAQLEMANMLLTGERVPPNSTQAVQLLRTLAHANFAAANLALAQVYLDGKFVQRDLAQARAFCESVAENDFHRFTCLESVFKADPPNYAELEKLYEREASDGYSPAMYNIAVMYSDSKTLPRDPAKAYMWAYIAQQWNVGPAKTLAATLKSELSKKEIAKAEKDAMKVKRTGSSVALLAYKHK